MKKDVLLMSACLMGVNCRYDGGGKTLPQLPQLMERYHVVPVCGEVMLPYTYEYNTDTNEKTDYKCPECGHKKTILNK